MAFSTHLQQVVAYLKQGHPLQPPQGTVLPSAQPQQAGIVPQAATPKVGAPRG